MLILFLTVIKNAILFICSFLTYEYLSKIKPNVMLVLDVIISIGLGTALTYLPGGLSFLIPIILLSSTYLYMFARFRQPLTKVLTFGVISCGITVFIMAIALLATVPFNFLLVFLIENGVVLASVTAAITNVLQLICLILLFTIKRLKSGLILEKKDGYTEILLLLSALCLFSMTLFYTGNLQSSFAKILVTFIMFCGIILILSLRKNIESNYHKRLVSRNEELYEKNIEDLEKEKAELLKQNGELSKIIHRDNKLVTAMNSAVKQIVSKADSKELKELLQELKALSSEHGGIIQKYQSDNDELPKTDVISTDAVLHFIYSKALNCGAQFNVNVADEVVPALKDKNITDVNTVICDLGENAVIAVKNLEEGKIKIAFETSDGAPCLAFYDNGALFDEKVIANMGVSRVSTHLHEGGSGIGLMTLFDIMHKCGASFYMDELLSDNEYTKCVKIIFNGLSKVQINTERESVKKICKMRSFT